MLSALAPAEREVIRSAMETSLRYISAREYQTRLGVTPQTVQNLVDAWPNVDDVSDQADACAAINNSLNELLHGVAFGETGAQEHLGVDLAEIKRVYHKWARARGWTHVGLTAARRE